MKLKTQLPMIRSVKKIKLFILCLFLVWQTTGQEGNLFFMDAAPQNSFYNPAIQYNRSLVLFSLTGFADINNNSFAIKNFFNQNDLTQKNYFDLPYLARHSKPYTGINAEISYALFYAGFKLKHDYYASFYISRKHNNNLLLPRDFFNLQYGNADYYNERPRQFNFDGASANLSTHLEYSFGISKEISRDFMVGMHLKVLNGLSIVRSDEIKASLTTKEDFSEITINADLLIQQSAPNSYDSISGHALSTKVLGFKNIFKNWGAAVDLGFWYQPSSQLTIMGSVTDFGFINWSVVKNLFEIKNEYSISGISVVPVDTGLQVNNSFETLEDTISALFTPKTINHETFNSRLYSNIYLAAQWQLNNPISVYGVYRAKGLFKYTEHYITAGLRYNVSEGIRLSASTSYKNSTALNLGLGFLWEHKYGQLFIFSENVEAILKASRNVNVMFGINFFIWQKKNSRNSFRRRSL